MRLTDAQLTELQATGHVTVRGGGVTLLTLISAAGDLGIKPSELRVEAGAFGNIHLTVETEEA